MALALARSSKTLQNSPKVSQARTNSPTESAEAVRALPAHALHPGPRASSLEEGLEARARCGGHRPDRAAELHIHAARVQQHHTPLNLRRRRVDAVRRHAATACPQDTQSALTSLTRMRAEQTRSSRIISRRELAYRRRMPRWSCGPSCGRRSASCGGARTPRCDKQPPEARTRVSGYQSRSKSEEENTRKRQSEARTAGWRCGWAAGGLTPLRVRSSPRAPCPH